MSSFHNSEPRPAFARPAHQDWDRPPWNRWSFQHIREVLPTAEVWRGVGPVSALPRQEVDLDGLAVNDSAGVTTTLSGLLDETYTDGFLVIRNGTIVYERYFNEMTARTLHLSQSVGKSVVGALAGVFAGRGLLDVSQLATHYLPELAATGWNGATVQQILDMTTGVTFSEEYTDPYSEVGQEDVASGWKPIPLGSDPNFVWSTHVWELILRLAKTERPHGAGFVYRSIETDVLAFLLERIAGQRLPELASEHIWQKIGAEESACFTVDPQGFALASGGFNATLRDYGRFGQMILNNGAGVVPDHWISETRRGNHQLFQAPYTYTLPYGAYHNQFWIEDSQSRNLMSRGVFGQMIYMDFKNQMVVVKLSSWPDFVNPRYTKATLAACHAIAKALT